MRHGCNVKNGLNNTGCSICVRILSIFSRIGLDDIGFRSLNILHDSSSVKRDPSIERKEIFFI